MKHVIIGSSAAGLSAAKSIRELSSQDEIFIITSDTHVHSRCMLHHFLAQHKTVEAINFVDETFFEKNRLNVLWDTAVTSVKPDENKVVCANGDEVTYDKLLIATGSKYFIPPINNFREAKNVFGFRDLIDAEKLDKVVTKGKKCVIVGSGLVGLDAAYALAARDVECHIVEMADRISPLQLDKTASVAYEKLFEDAGCTFYLSDGVEGSVMDDNSHITSILLKSGKEIACDFVVVAAGVRANLDAVDGSGINVDKGILVDDCLRTNIENIWAAGDVTGVAAIWPCAVSQGAVAAKNMCGIKTPYEDTFAFKNTMNFFGLTTLSVGKDTEGQSGEVIKRESCNKYEKYIIDNGILTFALVQGDISNTGFLQQIIKRKIPISAFKKPVFNLTYADFYSYNSENGKYAW